MSSVAKQYPLWEAKQNLHKFLSNRKINRCHSSLFLHKLERYNSSRLQMFFKIVVLKDFTIFTRKHQCWSLNFVKKRLQKGVKFASTGCELFKTAFLQNTFGGCYWKHCTAVSLYSEALEVSISIYIEALESSVRKIWN